MYKVYLCEQTAYIEYRSSYMQTAWCSFQMWKVLPILDDMSESAERSMAQDGISTWEYSNLTRVWVQYDLCDNMQSGPPI